VLDKSKKIIKGYIIFFAFIETVVIGINCLLFIFEVFEISDRGFISVVSSNSDMFAFETDIPTMLMIHIYITIFISIVLIGILIYNIKHFITTENEFEHTAIITEITPHQNKGFFKIKYEYEINNIKFERSNLILAYRYKIGDKIKIIINKKRLFKSITKREAILKNCK